MNKNHNRNKVSLWNASAIGVCTAAAILIPVLSGCSAGSAGAGAADSAGTTATTEEKSTAQTSAQAETSSEAETAVAALPEQLDEGEDVLADNGKYYTQSTGSADKTIDWDSVKKDYPDAIAWLSVPDTDIDCAVSSTESDTGVWLDTGNNATFSDPQTVLHGSTAEGSDLSAVSQYGDSEFFSKHPDLYLYTADGQILTFHVFASYEEQDKDLLTTYDCYDYDAFQDYINGIYNTRSMTSNLDASVKEDVINTWEILTIQASQGDGTDFLVQATLTGTENGGE